METAPRIRRLIRRSGGSRGPDFIALSARAIDTVEFLQSEWVNSGDFAGLDKERDALISDQDKGAYFTVPGTPPRRDARRRYADDILVQPVARTGRAPAARVGHAVTP